MGSFVIVSAVGRDAEIGALAEVRRWACNASRMTVGAAVASPATRRACAASETSPARRCRAGPFNAPVSPRRGGHAKIFAPVTQTAVGRRQCSFDVNIYAARNMLLGIDDCSAIGARDR